MLDEPKPNLSRFLSYAEARRRINLALKEESCPTKWCAAWLG